MRVWITSEHGDFFDVFEDADDAETLRQAVQDVVETHIGHVVNRVEVRLSRDSKDSPSAAGEADG